MGKWYILYKGESVGPMSEEEIKYYHPTQDTMVCPMGGTEWVKLFTVPELMHILDEMPQQPSASYSSSGSLSGKSKVAAGVLAILLGTLGIHYFYLGKVAGGILTILLSLVTCGLWEIITIIQGIVMLTMSDEEFDAKYVNTNKTFPLF
jgi:TM2 domain-containing membrane protein YozV